MCARERESKSTWSRLWGGRGARACVGLLCPIVAKALIFRVLGEAGLQVISGRRSEKQSERLVV